MPVARITCIKTVGSFSHGCRKTRPSLLSFGIEVLFINFLCNFSGIHFSFCSVANDALEQGDAKTKIQNFLLY